MGFWKCGSNLTLYLVIFVYWPIFYLKKSIFSPKWIFLINFIRILWFIWDLVLALFDIDKDVVSGKILVFGNVFAFPGVNWTQKWTKTFKFGYVLFPLKHLILKDCLDTVFLLWEATTGLNFSKFVRYLGKKGLRKPPKGWFHGCCITTKTFEHL